MTSIAESSEKSADPPMLKPLHLLRPDETHTSLVCIPEALAALRAITGPVKVCSLVGTQRQGKSSLLNLLHKRSCIPPGFGIGHYMDPKTHGLHFWSKPHPRSSDVTILYLDTEGLDAPHVDQFYNWTLSAVSLLISDVYMYQSKGSIDTGSIDRLAMILRVAEQLRGEASQGIRGNGKGKNHGDQGESEWQKAAGTEDGKEGIGKQVSKQSDTGASFLWLLRDHQLNMKYSPKEEMIEKLDTDALRTVRRCFDDYDCVPLPVPVDGGSKELQNMEQKVLKDLAEEFREEFVVLERLILDKLKKPRILAGQIVTGPMLADLLEAYTASVRKKDGAMADIAALPTQREMLVSLAGDRAIKAGIQHYKDTMCTIDGNVMGYKKLMKLHTSTLKNSIHIFENISMNVLDSDEIGKFRHTMIEKIIGWGTTMSTEKEMKSNADGSLVSSHDILLQKSSLKINSCLFGPLWSSNQHLLKTRCQKTLEDIYKPLCTSLNKRLGIANEEDENDANNDTDLMNEIDKDEKNKDEKNNEKEDEKSDKNESNTKTKTKSLPSLTKYMNALSKVRIKYTKHPFVLETPLSISTAILLHFERERFTPDTIRLIEASSNMKTKQLMEKLESKLTKQFTNEINVTNNHLKTLLQQETLEKNNAIKKSLQTQTKAIQEDVTNKCISMERNIVEERETRTRSNEETDRRFTSITTEQERIKNDMKNITIDLSENIKNKIENNALKLTNVMNEKNNILTNEIQENSNALRTEMSTLNTTVSTQMNACNQLIQTTTIEINEKINEKINITVEKETKKRNHAIELLSQNILTLQNNITKSENEHATLLQGVLEDYTTQKESQTSTNDCLLKINDLKKFVRKEFADHSEGMSMTHTKVENLETKIKQEHDIAMISMQEKVNALSTNHESHTKSTSDLRRAIKNSLDKTKTAAEKIHQTTEDRIIQIENQLKENTNLYLQKTEIDIEDIVLKKNLNDLKEQVYTALETKSTNNEITAMNEQLEQVSSNILLNTTSMNERALELDVHLKQFRTSLTDEIAQSISQCNGRVDATEKETKTMMNERLNETSSINATLEQVKQDFMTRMNDTNESMKQLILKTNEEQDKRKENEKNQELITKIEIKYNNLRDEMIRRDELLESQLLDAHGQMQRDAQAIVAPAKSQVENMRQQVNSLNERLALATESQGKKHEALNDQLKADVMIRVDHLTTQLSSLVEERESTITSTRQLESKVNKVYKTLSREVTKGKGDREGLWGSLSELSCRISELRSQIE